MNPDQLKNLAINPDQKRRRQGSLWTILFLVLIATTIAVYFAWPRLETRIHTGVKQPPSTNSSQPSTLSTLNQQPSTNNNTLLTVSGYIINRERIELSPRFLGIVKWIGVKKGDAVTNGQVVVLLDDTEYRARLMEAQGRLNAAQTAVSKAELDLRRIDQLAQTDIESKKSQDDARLQVDTAKAGLEVAEGVFQLAKTYLDWTVIRSPIDGVVLEKLVDPNELVVPQSFGGTRGPSTALIALADPKDLQVEIDMNEADLSKIYLNQKCRVSPEAYPDRQYDGFVAEIAPEANRSKGTLQIKVQIVNPDSFLTPELSARVDFLKE